MAEAKRPQPVQLVIGVIFGDRDVLPPLETELEHAVGTIESRSPVYAFDVTDYYGDEMGGGLKRVFYSFVDMISPERIVDVKVLANEIERRFSVGGDRRVNIDPGYMDFHKLVLASVKFLGQKIYLGKGVYADPTLYYDKGWKSYDWGFLDFRDGRYNGFLTLVRRAYKEKLRRLGTARNLVAGHGGIEGSGSGAGEDT